MPKQVATYEFEGEQRTVDQVLALAKQSRIVISEDSVRRRLRNGQKTLGELRRPIAKVNRAWNARESMR